jgi:hypothetical protein
LNGRIVELKALMEGREPLVPHRALGVGYEGVAGHPIGTITFEHDAPDCAAADLPARLLRAEDGMCTNHDAPIKESYFHQSLRLRLSQVGQA